MCFFSQCRRISFTVYVQVPGKQADATAACALRSLTASDGDGDGARIAKKRGRSQHGGGDSRTCSSVHSGSAEMNKRDGGVASSSQQLPINFSAPQLPTMDNEEGSLEAEAQALEKELGLGPNSLDEMLMDNSGPLVGGGGGRGGGGRGTAALGGISEALFGGGTLSNHSSLGISLTLSANNDLGGVTAEVATAEPRSSHLQQQQQQLLPSTARWQPPLSQDGLGSLTTDVVGMEARGVHHGQAMRGGSVANESQPDSGHQLAEASSRGMGNNTGHTAKPLDKSSGGGQMYQKSMTSRADSKGEVDLICLAAGLNKR